MASISQVKNIAYRMVFEDAGFTAGMNAAAEAAKRVGQAGADAAEGVKKTETEVRKAGPSIEALNKRYDENANLAARVAAANNKYEAELRTLTTAVAVGAKTQEQATEIERRALVARDAAIAKAQQGAAAQRALYSTTDVATTSTSKFGQVMGQAGFQVQDFFVQVQSGTSYLTALGQQGSQLLGIFGTGGAIAGAALVVGSLVVQLASLGKSTKEVESENERWMKSIEELNGLLETAAERTLRLHNAQKLGVIGMQRFYQQQGAFDAEQAGQELLRLQDDIAKLEERRGRMPGEGLAARALDRQLGELRQRMAAARFEADQAGKVIAEAGERLRRAEAAVPEVKEDKAGKRAMEAAAERLRNDVQSLESVWDRFWQASETGYEKRTAEEDTKRQSALAKAMEKAEEAREKAATTATDNIVRYGADKFADMFSENAQGWDAMLANFARGFRSMIARLAAEAILRPIIAPIVSGVMGGMGGGGMTLTGAMAALGLGSAAGPGGGSGLGITDYLGMAGTAKNAYGLVSGAGNSVSTFLGSTAYTVGDMGAATNAALGNMGGAYGPATSGQVAQAGAANVSYGAAIGGGLAVAGGAYGIYSGLERGGPGGYTTAAGGAVGVGAGLASLGALGPGLVALGPYGIIAAGVIMAIGAMLPGAPPSNMTGTSAIDLGTGEAIGYGQTGKKRSDENRAAAASITDSVRTMATSFQQLTGQQALGRVTVDMGNRDGLGFRVITPTADSGNLGVDRDAAGQAEFFRTVSTMMLQDMVPRVAEGVRNAIAGMPKATAEEILTGLAQIAAVTNGGNPSANQTIASRNIDFGADFAKGLAELAWVRDVYEPLIATAEATTAFQTAFDAMTKGWIEAIANANRLGLATDVLSSKLAEASIKLSEERNLAVNSAMDALTARSMRARGLDRDADLYSFDINATAERRAFQDQLEQWGLAAAQVAERMAILEQVQGEERLAVAQRYGEAITRAAADAAAEAARLQQQAEQGVTALVTSLATYARGLRTSTDSPLSAVTQYQGATREFQAVLGAAQAGDFGSMSQLTGFADTFLATSRAVNGSGMGYAADFARVVDALGALAAKAPEELTAAVLQSETRAQTATLASELQALRAEVVNLRREVAMGASAPRAAA